MSALPSRVTIEAPDDRLLVLSGVIDAHTAQEVLDRVRAAPEAGKVTLDLAAIEFMDSSGLRALITAHQERSADDRGRLLLTNVSEPVRRLLEITGLDGHLEQD